MAGEAFAFQRALPVDLGIVAEHGGAFLSCAQKKPGEAGLSVCCIRFSVLGGEKRGDSLTIQLKLYR